jgi:methyl-accepting chemotaxis protein
VKEQKEQLKEDGIESDIFYLRNNEVVPFKASSDANLTFSSNQVAEMSEKAKSVLHTTLNGQEYTLSTLQLAEISGQYILSVPQRSDLGPVSDMAVFTIIIILASLAASTILIILFVRTFTKPLVQLQKVMREVREGRLN